MPSLYAPMSGVNTKQKSVWGLMSGVNTKQKIGFGLMSGVNTKIYSALSIGDTYAFGGYSWTVVDINASGQATVMV